MADDDNETETELDCALARPDAAKLIRQIDIYIAHVQSGERDWPEEIADDLGEVLDSDHEDPEKCLAYVAIAAARTDDAEFLGFIGASLLENLLEEPTQQLLDRIVRDARRDARFRWLLSCPYKVAISEDAWWAIKQFRTYDVRIDPLPLRTSF